MKKVVGGDLPRISFGMIVVNGEPFIKYNLENLYPHAHEILVVEGAVEKFRHAATEDGHSIDDTVRIIREFPDPDNKIKLIQIDGFWTEKDEMSNAYMEHCTGDYIWQVDVDEFYKPEDIEKVRRLLTENPGAARVDIQTINFWHGFNAIMQGASYCLGADKFRRIFKFKPGYRYLTHRPPTVIDREGNVCCNAEVISSHDLVERLNVFMYHYSYVFEGGVKAKADYYARMGWGQGCEEGTRWAESVWSKMNNPLRVHLIDFPPSWIVPFRGTHPEIIEKMVKDLGVASDHALETFLETRSEKFAQIGEYICDLYKQVRNRKISRFKAALLILKNLSMPADAQVHNANMTVFKSAFKVASGK